MNILKKPKISIFFITKEFNPNYLKPILSPTNDKKKKFGKEKKDVKENINTENKIENKNINLNFDYNKYLLKAVVAKKKDSGKLEIFTQIVLNREICKFPIPHLFNIILQKYKNN